MQFVFVALVKGAVYTSPTVFDLDQNPAQIGEQTDIHEGEIMALLVTETLTGQAWVAQPNHLLTPKLANLLVLVAASISGGIALIFTAFGAWPVLPFAGLEVGALWLALRHLQRHAEDEERIEIGSSTITVTCRNAGRCEQHEFSRYWARLYVEKVSGRGDSRLLLRSHGREVEIGLLLMEEQKRALATVLRNRIDA